MNLTDFHFIRPYWLLAIFGLFIAVWLLKKLQVSQSGWSKLLPAHLSSVLIEKGRTAKSFSTALPFFIGLLAVIALAGPTWEKLPQPVYQVKRGSVLIMDMSYSMYATDLTPNRLTRARYKAIDLLDNINEGDIGLIAYAGDAFIISPLTEDINNIKLLLPSLSPDLMPELGSNPLAALHLANKMLTNAGHVEGDIYWFTDGIDYEDIDDINEWSASYAHHLNILGVGTTDGAPIKLTNGELLKDDNGAIVLPRLSAKYLEGVAQQSSGKYQTISHENSDISHLIKNTNKQQETQETQNSNTGDQWQEAGPYLVILLLPLLLGYFRRGVLSMLFVGIMLAPYDKALAISWDDLWKTKDQQAQQKFNQEQFKEAADSFEKTQWQGAAHYRAGDYEKALAAFEQGADANAFYNQGNSLAKLNKLDEAIAAYEQALALDPNLEDAAKNKEVIEKLKQQQEQQQSQQNQENQQQDGENEGEDQPQEGQQNQSDQPSQNQESKDQNNGDTTQPSADGQENEPQDSSDNQQSSTEQNNEESSPAESSQQDENKREQEQKNEKSTDAEPTDEPNKADEKAELTPAQQLRQEQLEQEKAQKYQQLLNKVTDDPHLLLRNKMQLEYQKRRQNGSQSGVKKKW